MEKFENIAAFFRSYSSFYIASHVSPDADAIGSTLGLGLALIDQGKRVTLYNVDRIPDHLRFIPYSERIVHSLGGKPNCEALILVDCAEGSRGGEKIASLMRRLPFMIIDHHIFRGVTPEAYCVDEQAASTASLLYRIFKQLGMRISRDIAIALYSGLVGDTGSFSYSNTTSEVFQMAADLLKAGVDPWQVSSNMFEQRSPLSLRLLGLVLDTLTIEEQGQYAHVAVSLEMMREVGALPEHTDEFVNYPRSLAGVEVAALFRQLDHKKWKVSLRSKRRVDVAAVAAILGGGGHEHAAGCTIDCGLGEGREQVKKVVSEALARFRIGGKNRLG